jgi:drug/metabolite transporter (DMT)-like permease
MRTVALLIGLIGALWVLFGGYWPSVLKWDLGMSLFLLGCFLLALYPLALKQWGQSGSLLETTTWVLITGTLWLLLAQLFFGTVWQIPDMDSLKAISWLAVITTMVTFFLFQYASLSVSGDSAHAYGYLNPVLVVVIGMFQDQPWPDVRVWPGMALVITALFIIQLQDQKKAPH